MNATNGLMPRANPDPQPLPLPPEPVGANRLALADVRRDLLELGGAEVARARRYGRPLGLVMLEAAGEHDIAAEVLHATVRTGPDRVLRLEPHRYVAVLPETALAGAMHLAARLQHRLLALGLRSKVGFAALEARDRRFLDVLARAQAMLES